MRMVLASVNGSMQSSLSTLSKQFLRYAQIAYTNKGSSQCKRIKTVEKCSVFTSQF